MQRVVAQGLVLTMAPADGVRIAAVHTALEHTVLPSGAVQLTARDL